MGWRVKLTMTSFGEVPAFAGSDNYRMTSVLGGKEIPARGPESYSHR